MTGYPLRHLAAIYEQQNTKKKRTKNWWKNNK